MVAHIIAYQRPEGSGSQTTLIRMMGDTRITEPPTDRVPSGMGGMVYRVAAHRNYSNALRFTFRYYATDMVRHDQIRLLKVDGVSPDIASIQAGTYPLTDEFYAVTRQEPSANIQKLIAWILSEQGQELISKSGYVPIQ